MIMLFDLLFPIICCNYIGVFVVYYPFMFIKSTNSVINTVIISCRNFPLDFLINN